MGDTLHPIDEPGLMLCFIRSLAILLLAPFLLIGQQEESYFDPDYVRMNDRNFDPAIGSVLFERTGEPMSEAIVTLGSTQTLTLRFDLLEEEVRSLSYRIIHCSYDWTPSVLSENDYIQGFYTDQISDMKHSLSTWIPYWHYELVFPNEQMRPSISGNYILSIFDQGDPDKVILSRRFRVVEEKCSIFPLIHRATAIELRNSHQEVDFTVDITGLRLANPYRELMVEIIQNGDHQHSIKNLKPLFVNGNTVDYNYEEGNLFEGGSEFRFLDIRTTRFLTGSLAYFEPALGAQPMQAHLKAETRTSTQRYSSSEDLNGKFIHTIYEGRNAHLEADYLMVHFKLKSLPDFSENPVFVQGKLTDNRIEKPFRMTYNQDSACFELKLLLKQGLYNYRYVTSDSSGNPNTLETEGSHQETENQYEILVFLREPVGRHDRLIGYRVTRTGRP
ncbi:MAG: hypothetical protein RLZZ630_1945 [Bacteroidota bacterium]